ncbi:proline-rich receptor-like protein kinase PERK2 isoform X2 [Carica papaya]|nr:proline-rich receptor-like protein kinase PERK2 isoform X2 [Carica papaya]XP_021897132.1 proline-rich receptor-like protein kinase PERK2 isoform X2 [Carica papaya]XP_021897133.1 proline-rich receptor-like protein kinase PERK2 isoform X2 [Carica papaya]
MLSTVTPCLNFLTNSTANGTSPTSDCCNALKSLTGNSMDCVCLVVTGNVPLTIPINRTLAISLPRACNMPGVPLQCKASAAPLPAPGPVALGPILSPGASPSSSTEVPQPTPSASQPPESDTTPSLTPPVDAETPNTTAGSRPVLTPSAAPPASSLSPYFLLLFAFGLVGF